MTTCPACGHDSETIYRCDECGKDLVETDDDDDSAGAAVLVPDGGQFDSDRCEDCGGEIDTPRLTPDGHPKGPNLVVCIDCETRHIGGEQA